MAKSADEVLKELASGEITIKDVLKISLSKTETAEILNNIVDKLGSWEALKDYAKFLSKKGVLNKKSSLKTYIGKKKEAKKQKIAKEKEEGESESEEDEEDIEEIETEDESEEDESEEDVESGEEEEEQTEIKPMLSKEEFEKAKLLAERIKREKEDTHKKESTQPSQQKGERFQFLFRLFYPLKVIDFLTYVKKSIVVPYGLIRLQKELQLCTQMIQTMEQTRLLNTEERCGTW